MRTITWWFAECDELIILDTGTVRTGPLRLRGVGLETVNNIVLFAYRRQVFTYDLYVGEHRTNRKTKHALGRRSSRSHSRVLMGQPPIQK